MFGRIYFYAPVLNYIRSLISSSDSEPPPIVITSGYRSVTHNRRVGGARNSNHLRGLAIDVACPPSVSMNTFISVVNNVFSMYALCGSVVEILPYRKKRFIHISI